MDDNRNDLNNIQELPDIESYTDSILFKNFLSRNQEEKKELKLEKEIKKKKYQISHMFNTKFGKNFLNQKPESLKIFEKRFAKYYFDPDSQFLSKFPKLQRKLRHEKKISEELLKSKIDIGSMIFYDLRGKNMKKTRNINIGKERLLTISKNFSYTPVKDVVENTFYKKKFWEKNSKRIKNYFKNKLAKYNENFIEEKDEYKDNKIDLENEDNSSSKDLISKDSNTLREKGNLKLNVINNTITNNSYNLTNFKTNKSSKTNNETIIKKNLKNNIDLGYNKTDTFNNMDKIGPSSLNIKINDSATFGLKDRHRKRSSINNSNDNYENEKLISSYNADFKKIYDLIPKITNYNNLSRNRYYNISNIFTKSNSNNTGTGINKINMDNIINIKQKTNKFAHTTTNFNKNNNKIFNNFKNSKYSPRFYLQKQDDALKKKKIKFKSNFNSHVSRLNQYTNKCNTELIKLIDGNNDDNYKERKKNIIMKTKLDIKEILSSQKKTINDKMEKKLKEKEKEKDTVKNLIKVAIYDIGDNFGESNPKMKERILKKNINYITDEQALEMIDTMVEKQKELDVRKIIGNNEKLQLKKENNMNIIREKTKNNYEKMLKLTNMIQIDKRKLFKK